MAFGKKKDEQAPAAAAAPVDEEPLFPADDGEDEPPAAAGSAAAPAAEDAPAPPPVPEPADALLSMFQADDSENEDRSVVLELAGDVDLADLLDDLHTLAAAMGIEVRA
jgi:hypothetical protein